MMRFARELVRSSATLIALVGGALPVASCAEQNDTTVAITPNAHIQIQNFAGSITIHAWDRAAVRIAVGPSRRDEVRVRTSEGAMEIVTVSRSGVPAPHDYDITVPSRASLDVGGTYTDITIEGVRGSVSATTVQGAVSLQGGDGAISLKSVEGTVSVQGAQGRVEVNGVNKGLTLRNVVGDVAAETVNGSIVLDSITSANVEAATVNGEVKYYGTITDRGRYRFASHSGTITLAIPERANATIAAVTYQGTFSSRFTLPASVADRIGDGPRRRANVVFGDGSARIEAESFQGSIVHVRPGEPCAR
jgi:prepilin-type processing-associated H-X9-DG protein